MGNKINWFGSLLPSLIRDAIKEQHFNELQTSATCERSTCYGVCLGSFDFLWFFSYLSCKQVKNTSVHFLCHCSLEHPFFFLAVFVFSPSTSADLLVINHRLVCQAVLPVLFLLFIVSIGKRTFCWLLKILWLPLKHFRVGLKEMKWAILLHSLLFVRNKIKLC